MSAHWADTLLRNEGNGLPRQCTHWLAMTYLSFLFAYILDAESIENHCHCEEHSDVAIRTPCIRRMLGGHRPPHSPTPKNDNLSYDTLTDLRRAAMAPFSSRDTWAWEIPRESATSIWVFPS